MSKIGAYIFVIFIAGTVCYSLLKKRNVFQDFTELSMGMTGDLEVAIEEGATMIRVGSALFR